jgi:hypothetical protein
MDFYTEYFRKMAKEMESHLAESFKNLLWLLPLLACVFILLFLFLKIMKKWKLRKHYNNVFRQLCFLHNLEEQERFLLISLSSTLHLKHPVFLFVQPLKWQEALSRPEVEAVYKKLF